MSVGEEIARIVGAENVFCDPIECLCYSRDMSVHEGIPDAVVLPRSTEQVSRILKLASREGTPVTPRGAGTSVTGAVLPVRGGLVLDMHLMNRILEVNRPDFYARVEPGVVCAQLNVALAEDGLMFPPNPGSEAVATIGGMVSTNASGHRAVKYGTTKDYLKGLTVVLADGSIIKTGTVAPKTSLGYDLTHLFAGAEGTLGVITEIIVRIQKKPEYVALALAIFGNLNAAGDAVTEVSTSGIRLSGCEILGKYSLKVVEEALGRDVSKIEALLIMEADGARAEVVRDMTKIEDICKRHGVSEFEWSDDPRKREEMMAARGGLVPTLSRIRPFNRLIPIAEDLGVPPSKIPETIRRARAIAEKHGVVIATFGHVGDGNVHTTFVADVRSRDDWDRLKPAVEELVETALEMQGTLSAEHGVGLTRAPHIERQLGPGLDVMRKIKRALDPAGILNPGKLALEEGYKDIYDYFAFKPLLACPERANSFGEQIDNEIIACIHCGFCRLGCPTFSVTHRESRDARGRNVLAFHLMNGTIEPSKELAEVFYSCTVCQACTYFCPAQIKVDEVVVGTREKLSKAGFVPQPAKVLSENILKTGNVYGSPEERRVDVYPAPLRRRARSGIVGAPARTLIYMGCVPSYLDVRIVPSLLETLDRAAVDYAVLGTHESCCGFPLHLLGSGDFRPHAEKLAAEIRATGARELVTPCAGCYKAFKKIYPEIVDLGLEVYHSIHYLARLIDQGRVRFDGGFNKTVTYHDPCDLGRGFRIFEEPRHVLTAIPGLEYVEMTRNRLHARCCGGGGAIQASHPELAVDMAQERVRDALAVGAEIIVSGCAACKNNLRKGARALPRPERGRLRIMDLTELVAVAME